MLGVEPDDADRTGVPRQLNVRVNSGQRGSIVRARSWVVVPKPEALSRPRQRARTAASTPEPRVATVALHAEDVAAYERLWRRAHSGTRRLRHFRGPRRDHAAGRRHPLRSTVRGVHGGRSRSSRARRVPRTTSSGTGRTWLRRWRQWKKEWSATARDVRARDRAHGVRSSLAESPDVPERRARHRDSLGPTSLAARPDDDTFELRFHRAAVAILAAAGGPARSRRLPDVHSTSRRS